MLSAMRLLITGASGFIGHSLCRALFASGHEVYATSRNPKKTHARIPDLKRVFSWDLQTPPTDEALVSMDAVIHLAGEPVTGRWTKDKKQRILRSREQGTRSLVDGLIRIQGNKPKLISISAIGYYGDRGTEELTEDSQSGDDFLARVCIAWEREAVRASKHGISATVFRLGIALGHQGGSIAQMWRPFSMGMGGPLGSGKQYWSWVHIDDVVNAILHCLKTPDMSGVFNLTAPQPVTQKVFTKTLGRIMGRPTCIPAPASAIKLALGGFAVEILSSKCVYPKRLLETGC